MANTQEVPPSRLSLSTAKLRDDLESRNLYTPDSEYPLQSTQNTAKVVSTINTVIGALTPFKSYNLENTVYGRLIQGNANTPLAQIGLAMLGKQMALNLMSNASQQLLPVIKVTNLFDGNPSTNLFTPHVDFGITKIATNNTLSDLISRIVGTKNPSRDPFSESSTNSTYLSNTGSGQLVFMLDQLNKNIYKSADTNLNQIATEVKDPIQPRYNLVSTGNKSFFNFTDANFNPYIKFHPSTTASVEANKSMINAYNGLNIPTQTYSIPIQGGNYLTVGLPTDSSVLNQEYAPDQNFINNLGYTQKYASHKQPVNSIVRNNWIGNETEFVDDQEKKIAWGWTGVSKDAADILNDTLGTFGGNGLAEDTGFNVDFNVKGAGLLEYTKNLLNATEGRIADITRKAFVSGDEIMGFNGSGLWKSNNSIYAQKSGTAGYTGVRQHSVLDPYDKFAKTIRFNGNNVYNGNPDSVIFNSVMPRIHPTPKKDDKDKKWNTNLMLSIENLAIRVISKDNVGIIDDEYGSQIPACEVGPFNGRMMWFPPYGLELNETATAKYEPTVMVGRNEPMYNYQNSERNATLNFMLLIDYPPQVKNYDGSKTHQKDVAEFFAFGGDTPPLRTDMSNIPAKIRDLELQKQKIIGRRKPKPVEIKTSPTFFIFFPNDEPNKSGANITSIIDDIYEKGYEVSPLVNSNYGGDTSTGLNHPIYYINGLVNNTSTGSLRYDVGGGLISQYVATDDADDFGVAQFNQALRQMFQNPDDRPYYSVYIEGHTSALATTKYNFDLSKRRIAAAQHFVEQKIKSMFGADALTAIGVVTTKPLGETGAVVEGETKAGINLPSVKQDRWASIKFSNNGKQSDELVVVDEKDKIDLANIEIQLSALQGQLNNSKKQPLGGANLVDCAMNEKTEYTDAILHGFQSMKGNYYQHVFHSQTPEDFHKRLTFLQQCTRQGSAKIYESKPDANGILRARNSVFGRQPICILRIGDFFYTKVVIESINFDYTDTTWDMNPEGFGMQPMIAKITLNMKVIGGQSLKGPIDALQNAVAFNYYANSTFTNEGLYKLPSYVADQQNTYINGVNAANVQTAQANFNSLLGGFLATNSPTAKNNIFSYNDTDYFPEPPK